MGSANMRLYRVVSRRWRVGYILARSSLHAVTVAQATGIHQHGKRIVVHRISTKRTTPEVQEFIEDGVCGRLLFPHPLRKFYLLIYNDDEQTK